jgi:hypothetical protein
MFGNLSIKNQDYADCRHWSGGSDRRRWDFIDCIARSDVFRTSDPDAAPDANLVRDALLTMVNIAQSTAAGATETSSAAGELSRLATLLDQLVNRYKLSA